MTCTRPDIAYTVSTVAQFASDPSQEHWMAVKRIFRYLKKTRGYGLVFKGRSSQTPEGYSDADWAGGYDRTSVGAFVFILNETAISWCSKKQSSVALSLTESEYMALTQTGKEAIWIRKLLRQLPAFTQQLRSTMIYGDNQSSLALAHNGQYHSRTKHIDIQYHWIRENVIEVEDPISGLVPPPLALSYCPTTEMVADALTKALSDEKLKYFAARMGLYEETSQGLALNVEDDFEEYEELEGMWYFDTNCNL